MPPLRHSLADSPRSPNERHTTFARYPFFLCNAIAPPVYAFEPHQTEQCEWMPNTFLDITEVWDVKRRAIECMAGQEHLWEYYTRVALQRGVQAKRNIGITAARDIQYAEGYQRITPAVTGDLA